MTAPQQGDDTEARALRRALNDTFDVGVGAEEHEGEDGVADPGGEAPARRHSDAA